MRISWMILCNVVGVPRRVCVFYTLDFNIMSRHPNLSIWAALLICSTLIYMYRATYKMMSIYSPHALRDNF
jgi:hypothetical protein